MKNYLLNVRWKIETCNSGTDCWCRLIVPETPEDEGDYVIGDGSIGADVAEHLVKLHNEKIDALAKEKAKKAKAKKDKEKEEKLQAEILQRQQTNLAIYDVPFLVETEILEEFDKEGNYSYDYYEMSMGETLGWNGLSSAGFYKVIDTINALFKIHLDNINEHSTIQEIIDRCKEIIDKCKTQNEDGTYKL